MTGVVVLGPEVGGIAPAVERSKAIGERAEATLVEEKETNNFQPSYT